IVVDGWVGSQTRGALAGPAPAAGARTMASAAATDASSFVSHAGAAAPSGRIEQMLDWAHSMIGSPYAAVNPFRFGEVLWDGGRHGCGNGSSSCWKYPKGTRVFDCSGFVVAAYRQLGVDLAARNLASSSTMRSDRSFLRPIDQHELRPGDLITYAPKNGV